MGEGTGACLVACETTPGRRDCAGSDCPECYSGGNCSSYSSSAFSQEASLVAQGIQTIYCDDSFSPDGLTHAEQQCQRGLTRAGGRFIEALLRCTANCEKAVQRGTTGFSSCQAAFVDTPTFDPKAQRCIDRARATLLKSCGGHCQDPPDCFDLTCSQTAAFLEQEAAALQPATYCQEPGVCGDGQVTGAEMCDYGASPSGCGRGEQCSFGCQCFPVCGDGIIVPPEVCDPNASPTGCDPGYQCSFGCGQCTPICGDGIVASGEPCDQSAPQNGCTGDQVCESCEFRVEPCGDGVLDPGEVCERASVGTCELGTACNATCDACNPTESGTEDVPGCNSSASDTWTFQVTSGQNVVVRLDTDGFNGLELFVSCPNGFFFSAFDNLQCSNGSFGCAGTAFVTDSDASCSVAVEPIFCESGTIDYRLDVSGTDLTLVTDDGNPASPSGAFVDTPTGEARSGA
jgi:hypothetical protein